MMSTVNNILQQHSFSKRDIITLLRAEGDDKTALYTKSASVKQDALGNVVYYRGLIEFSNICAKNCFYCGIRKDNAMVNRYNVSDDEIIQAAQFAYRNNYGSVVLQSGELVSEAFTRRIETLCRKIKSISEGQLGITLSCGEQSRHTYQRWFKAGAHRYLLRIEASDETLYKQLHPNNSLHNYHTRLKCLHYLKEVGYQCGTGVMVGVPGQTIENLADDLLFLQLFDIDMVGMGPYIEHEHTPLFLRAGELMPLTERFELTLKMIAVLRILMKDINIAAATAMQAIDKLGREKAIKAGANILMPNVTPGFYRDDYALYQNKPCTDENAEDCKSCLEVRVGITNHQIGYGKWGDSLHFERRRQSENTNKVQ